MTRRLSLVAMFPAVLAAAACSSGGSGAKSSDARAASITLSAGTLAPPFTTVTAQYYADVPAASTSSVGVTVTPFHAGATATVNGAPAAAGTAHAVAIASGSNVVTVVVTAEDGVATATYALEIFGIDVYADASAADDLGPGDAAHPFKTLTTAIAAAGAGKAVKARPGTYDAANGEMFPLRLSGGQILVGDPATRGSGSTATLVKGYGAVPEAGGFPAEAALVGAAGSRVSGFALTADSPPNLTFLVLASPGTQTVSRNGFDPDAQATYGGVYVSGAVLVEDNVFDTSSYGTYLYGASAGTVIRANRFLTVGFPVEMTNGDGVLVEANQVTGNGQIGVSTQGGAPTIRGNTFDLSTGYTYGAIHPWHGSPVIRANVFACARGVLVDDAQPDLGTAADPGENDFSAVTGTALLHMGTGLVTAVGNRWPHSPPTSSRGGATDIVVNRTGTATWDAGQVFPTFIPTPFSSDASTLALWHMDDSGQTLSDASGHGLGLVLGASTAPEPVDPYANETGMFGTAQYYYTWNDAYSSGTASLAFPSTALSVELWYRAGFADQKQGTIFAAGTASVAVRWVNGQLTFSLGDGASYQDVSLADAAVNDLLANQLWHALACTYDGATARIYLDGELRLAAPSTVAIATQAGYWVGGLPASGHSMFGLVDEVRLSGVARSAAEIAATYGGP